LATFLDELAGTHAAVIHIGSVATSTAPGQTPETNSPRATDPVSPAQQKALAALRAPWLVSVLVVDGSVGGDAVALALACSLRVGTSDVEFWDPSWAEGRMAALFTPALDATSRRGVLRLSLGDSVDAASAVAYGLIDVVARDRRAAVDQAEHWAKAAAATPRSLVAESRAVLAASEAARDARSDADAWERWRSEREGDAPPEQ
jgi:enoyl-CoA hydratase/carnithine racemase